MSFTTIVDETTNKTQMNLDYKGKLLRKKKGKGKKLVRKEKRYKI